jgi:hypothetical protein
VCSSAGLEVDPELAGDGAVDRAGAAVGAGRAGLLLGRQAAHLDIAAHQRVERLRHLGADERQPLLDEGHDSARPLSLSAKR